MDNKIVWISEKAHTALKILSAKNKESMKETVEKIILKESNNE